MANVLNKTSNPVDYRKSVNDPDYPTSEWFINPDISAVTGVDRRYWSTPLTDPVTEMTQPEKDAVDLAISEASKDSIRDQLDVSDTLGAFAKVILDEINILRVNDSLAERTLEQLKTAVRNKL